jgi:hypothetical protein
MALADGELEGEARARAERLAAESDEGRRLLTAIRSSPLAALLGEAMAERTAVADGIADAVMRQVQGGQAGQGSSRSPESGAEHERGAGGPEVVVRIPYPTRRVSGGSRTPVLVAAAFSALALAAGLAVYIRSRDVLGVGATVTTMPSIAPNPVASVVPPTPATSQSAKALAHEGSWPPPGVQVDAIDSPSHDVHVFEIPAAAASAPKAPSVVIMIEDEPRATQ